MPGSPRNPASWPCVHTYDARLSEAARPSRSLLHGLLVLLGQVEQSVFYRLCGNGSKPKVTERGQSWPHRSVHFQKTSGSLRRLLGSINRHPTFSSEPCATLWFRHPLLCACPHLKSEENPIPSTAFSRPNGCGPLSQSGSTAASRLPRPSSKAKSLLCEGNADYNSQRPPRQPRTAIPSKLRVSGLRRAERQHGVSGVW